MNKNLIDLRAANKSISKYIVLVMDWFLFLFSIWNLCCGTRPQENHPEFPVEDCVCGMAYDATSDDYKIIAVDYPNAPVAAILALKSGSWRRIGYPRHVERFWGFRDCDTDYLGFVHGAFHWLGISSSGYCTALPFNISNEVFGEVPLLKHMFDRCPSYYYVDHGVSVLRGTLCFYSTCNFPKKDPFIC